MRLSATTLGTSVEADLLRELRNRLSVMGYESLFLDTRLGFQEAHQVLSQYLIHFAACVKCGAFRDEHDNPKLRHAFTPPERIHPSFLPTQADGRWSVTRP